MRTKNNLILLACCMAVLLLPTPSSSEVKITLKNGRTIIADYCREAGGKLLCDMSGGTFEFSRQEIESMKEVKIERRSVYTSEPDAAGNQEAEKKEEVGKQVSDIKEPVKTEEARLIKGLSPEQARKIDQLNEKKAAMKAERERLIRDREQLSEDVKNAGVVRNREQIDEFKKRIADLEKRIADFNEAAKNLNSEEERIINRGSK